MKKKLFLIILIVLSIFLVKNAKAASSDNITGYAWSENIGWISFNCTNDKNGETCKTTSNYGVNIDEVTGDFSGYAWSENIGWISFQPEDVGKGRCCIEDCRANFDSGTGEVTGFARVLSSADGWDGCLGLRGKNKSGETYGVSIDPLGNFSGWAWSDNVLGWVSFDCNNKELENCKLSTYQVKKVFAVPNNSPKANMSCHCDVPGDCDGSGCKCNGTWETYNYGGDDHNNAIYIIINQSTDTDPGDSIAASDWKLRDAVSGAVAFQMNCPGVCNYTIQDTDAGNYNIELKVTDQGGKSATTSHLIRIKEEAIAGFECSLAYSENPDDWKTCDNEEFKNKMPGTIIYFKDDLPDPHLHSIPSDGGSFIVNRIWTLNGIVQAENNSTSSIVLSKYLNSIELTIEDDQAETRTAALKISIKILIPAPPMWKEVSPVSFAEKILAFISRIFRV